ncbi:hypothetical protein B4U79_16582 [Dinothrombium tinctorium]|uniref:C2H2-type domain-containing protein n=1 Tax=Dinothrombium tinctorium TaxID=1965070 RepID=A0A3S3P146_9ACAR|nr:hypothetical protein B4U79_16582 [Dinothrombium tinctorium]
MDIAKVFDIKLITKNIDNGRILVKAMVQKPTNGENNEVKSLKSKKVKSEADSNVHGEDSESNYASNVDECEDDDNRSHLSNRNKSKLQEESDDDENELDEDSEDVPQQTSSKSRHSSRNTAALTNGSSQSGSKDSTNMFIEDKYYYIQQVKGQRVYKCKLCPKSYENVSRIRNHFQVKHLTLIFRCTKCSQKFDTRYNVVKHVKMVHKVFRGWRHFYTHTIIGSDSN